MTHVVTRLNEEKRISEYFRGLSLELDQIDKFGRWIADWKEIVLWKSGRLTTFSDQKEYLYFYFYVLKRSQDFVIPARVPGCRCFYMGREGISYYNETAGVSITGELPDNAKNS